MKHEHGNLSTNQTWEILNKRRLYNISKIAKRFETVFYSQFKKPIDTCWDKKEGILLDNIIGFEPNSWKDVKNKIGFKGLFLYLKIFKQLRISIVPDWSIKYKTLSFKLIKQKIIYYKRILYQIYSKNLFILRVLYLSEKQFHK